MRYAMKEKLKMKLIDAAIPAGVGISMLVVTWFIVGAVKDDILKIAEQAATTAVDRAFSKAEPAIMWMDAKALTPEVKIGGTLTMEYKAVIKKQCPADIRAFILTENTETAVYRFPDQQGGYRRAAFDPQTWQVSITITDPPLGSGLPPLPAGDYKYRATAIRYCDRIELDSLIPDVSFKLIR